jgi:hypothetical protein
MLYADDLARTSWQCVHFESAQDITALSRDLLERGMQVPVLEGGTLVTKEALLMSVAAALRFPEHFASNWDAFDECIRDLEWLPGTGCALVIRESTLLWQLAPQVAGELLSSWLAAAELWANDDVPFHLIFLFE